MTWIKRIMSIIQTRVSQPGGLHQISIDVITDEYIGGKLMDVHLCNEY